MNQRDQRNQFIEIVQTAEKSNWCTRLYCTTCGNKEIRRELRKIAGEGGIHLAKLLSSLTPTELVSLPKWEDCVRLAFIEISFPGLREKVLNSWIEKLNNEIYFADVVLYYIVRSFPLGKHIKEPWIKKCVALALESGNESLIESLFWVLKNDINDYPKLLDLAKEMNSSKINKALSNTPDIYIKHCRNLKEFFKPKTPIKFLLIGESPPMDEPQYYYVPQILNNFSKGLSAQVLRGFEKFIGPVIDKKAYEESLDYLRDEKSFFLDDLSEFPLDNIPARERVKAINESLENFKIRYSKLNIASDCKKCLVLPYPTLEELRSAENKELWNSIKEIIGITDKQVCKFSKLENFIKEFWK